MKQKQLWNYNKYIVWQSFPGRRKVPTGEVSFSDEQNHQLIYSDINTLKSYIFKNYLFTKSMLNSFEIYDKHPPSHNRSS